MRRTTSCLLLAFALLSSGCLTGIPKDSGSEEAEPESREDPPARDAHGEAPPSSETPQPEPASPSSTDARGQPHVTVAVVDTGANLYHEAFQRDRTWQLPAEAGAEPIELSLDAPDWETAVERDRSRLEDVERGTLYRLPGTVFVGAISFTPPGPSCVSSAELVCEPDRDWPRLLDNPSDFAHGTATTGRLAATDLSLAGDEPRIGVVLVQMDFGEGEIEAIEWASEQPWIDAISLSLRESPDSGDYATYLEVVDEAAHKKPVFKAVGNGIPDRVAGGLVPKPTWAYDGTPDEIAVGGVDNEDLYKNGDLHPYVAADACRTPKVPTDSMSGTTKAGDGTSYAAPYAAGAAARLILEARDLLGDAHIGPRVDETLSAPEDAWRSGYAGDATIVLARGEPGWVDHGPLADGVFTLRDLKDVLYHTASPAPTEHPHDGDDCYSHQVPAEPLPARARFASMGYGEVNAAGLDRALAVLQGGEELPDRPSADEAYERAHELRSETMGPRTATGELPGALDGEPARSEPLTSP